LRKYSKQRQDNYRTDLSSSQTIKLWYQRLSRAGTMGNEQSAGQQNDWGKRRCYQADLGYHVLRVLANSSAANAGIEPWFDYICGVNSTKIVCHSNS